MDSTVDDTAPSPAPEGPLESRFRLEAKLGQGAVGEVYRAWDTKLQVTVALKVLKTTDPRASTVVLERFQREGDLTRRLDHPCVVKLHDAGVLSGTPFLAYELIDGARTLADALPLARLQRRVELIRDVARGVGAAHALGIVHRDLKPENCLLDLAGQVRVADFGLATSEQLTRLTLTGRVVGTPYYMAPEQVTGARDRTGPPTDVWALGVILYRALTDAHPFDGATMVDLAEAILACNPIAPATHRPDVPPLLAQVCSRALSLDPAARYADGAAFADALDAYLATGATVHEGRRNRGWLGVSAVVVVALGAVVASSRQQPGPAGPVAHVAPAGSSAAPRPDPALVVEGPSDLEAAAEAGQAWAMRRLGQRVAPRDASEARRWFERAAQIGDVPSMVELGQLLLASPDRDLPAARRWFGRAAEAGDAEGRVQLGRLLRRGRGGPRDLERAVALFSEAAQQGSPHANYQLGLCYQRGEGVQRDPAEAAARFRRSAAGGFRKAMTELGLALENGRGVARDERAAVAWYHKGAALGSAASMCNLGVMHQYGRGGLEANPAKAITWYRKAIQAGSRVAMTNLAFLFKDGKGVPRDLPEAVRLFAAATERGHPRATTQLGVCYRDGVGVPVDVARARRLFLKAAEQGETLAMIWLGQLLERGGEVPTDCARAKLWYERAARRGESNGWLRLGVLHEYGRIPGKPADAKRAAALYRRASRVGNRVATTNLGLLFLIGKGVPKDPVKAVRLLQRAADQGYSRAMAHLAQCYRDGVGVDPDRRAARDWAERGARAGNQRAQKLLETLERR